MVPVSHKLVVSTRRLGTCKVTVNRREDRLELQKHPVRLQHYAVVAGSPELITQFALCARRGDQGACAHTDLERELLSVDREEAKLVKEIKSAAAKGNESSARVLAKSLVRLRGQKAKLHAGILQMRGVRSAIAVRATAVIGAPSRPCPACSQACGFTTVSDIANNFDLQKLAVVHKVHSCTEQSRLSLWCQV